LSEVKFWISIGVTNKWINDYNYFARRFSEELSHCGFIQFCSMWFSMNKNQSPGSWKRVSPETTVTVPHEGWTFSKTELRNQWNASNIETKIVPSHSIHHTLLPSPAGSVIIPSRRVKRQLCWNVWLLLPFKLSLACQNSFQPSYPVYINVTWNFGVNLFRLLTGRFATNTGRVSSRSTHDIRIIFPK
jgi:hypothetical protein